MSLHASTISTYGVLGVAGGRGGVKMGSPNAEGRGGRGVEEAGATSVEVVREAVVESCGGGSGGYSRHHGGGAGKVERVTGC